MKAVIVAPRQSVGQLYARLSGFDHQPIVVTPRATSAVRGQADVTHVIILGSMVHSPQLLDVLRVVKPAAGAFVTLTTTLPAVSREDAHTIETAWSEAGK
ncbi:MAG: hypothetical protein ABI566_03675 [Pseudolysinimonas sp.]